MTVPWIAITMGDPAGVGPEVVARALDELRDSMARRCLVVGRPELLERALRLIGSSLEVVSVDEPPEDHARHGHIACLIRGRPEACDVPAATVDARGGQAAYEAVVCAARLALAGHASALVTAPLNKAALRAAGHAFPGHTELLAHLCGVERASMMLYAPRGERVLGPAGLGVVHATLHTSLRDAIGSLDEQAILTAAHHAHQMGRRLLESVGLRRPPRLAVCALNPHGGEQGLFGVEEQAVIRPAVERLRGDGHVVDGPLPADTLMARAARGDYDMVIAMYHDQGHIALKVLDLYGAVNITLGLPILRVSVAHGTAFDLAWQGKAESRGMVQALRVACQLAQSSICSRSV